MNEKQLKRINQMLEFAEKMKKDNEKSLKLYKAGSKTDDTFLIFHNSEISQSIIQWEWVIDSLNEVKTMK